MNRSWIRRGPKILGYEPGWLWWAAGLVVLLVGAAVINHQIRKQQINEQYINERIEHHAQAQGLDGALVMAVVEAESGGDWLAESDAGAMGLMQVTPIALDDVIRLEGIRPGNLFEVDYNLQVGTLYLAYLLDRFDGDVTLAIAAYHMGPTALGKGIRKYPKLSSLEVVNQHAGPKTKAYVKKVLAQYDAD